MAIYEPQPKLSSTERALLVLLAQLAAGERGKGVNVPPDQMILSDQEADLLLRLLEEFSSSKKFVESAYFVERLTQADIRDDDDIKEIYLSWRKFYGRSRSMASTHWYDFLRRYGRIPTSYGYIRGFTRISDEMKYSHFREMERLLLQRSGVGERVKSIILSVIDQYEAEVEYTRHGDRALPEGAVSKLPAAISRSIQSARDRKLGYPAFSAAQAAGLMTVLTDVSVLFTTRDWGVAGTISTIAGGFAATAYPQS